MKVFIALCFIGMTLAAPQFNQQRVQQAFIAPEVNQRVQHQPIQHQPIQQRLLKDEIIEIPQPYNFGLQVNDDETTNYQSRQESQDELGNVQGEYSWIGSDGFKHITIYSATPEGGFQAKTIKEPTDIKVIIPVPKPEFQNVQTLQHVQQNVQQPGGRF